MTLSYRTPPLRPLCLPDCLKLSCRTLLCAAGVLVGIGCTTVPEVENRLQNLQFHPNLYVVQANDTIDSIAWRYQLSPMDLIDLNPGLESGPRPGQRLNVVPGTEMSDAVRQGRSPASLAQVEVDSYGNPLDSGTSARSSWPAPSRRQDDMQDPASNTEWVPDQAMNPASGYSQSNAAPDDYVDGYSQPATRPSAPAGNYGQTRVYPGDGSSPGNRTTYSQDSYSQNEVYTQNARTDDAFRQGAPGRGAPDQRAMDRDAIDQRAMAPNPMDQSTMAQSAPVQTAPVEMPQRIEARRLDMQTEQPVDQSEPRPVPRLGSSQGTNPQVMSEVRASARGPTDEVLLGSNSLPVDEAPARSDPPSPSGVDAVQPSDDERVAMVAPDAGGWPREEIVPDDLDFAPVDDGSGAPEGGDAFSGRWSWPTDGQIVRGFQPDRVGGQGVDIAGVPGQDVKAAMDGTVVYSGRDLSGEGNLIILRHPDELLSTYSHARDLYVAEDDVVSAGDSIASLGANEDEESVLGFEIRRDGNPLNPMDFLPVP